jgi:hypothetical protein
MKTPPGLIGATLMLWGWQSQMLLPALAMAAVLEGARFVKIRWEMSESDISRVSDLCTIVLAMIVLIAFNQENSRFLILVIQWLPVAVFPLIAAQRFSRRGMV